MSATDRDRALELLSDFTGAGISSIECDEFQLRLFFEDKSIFVTESPWRLFLRGDLLVGSGDIKEGGSEEIFQHLKRLKANSLAISGWGDTQLAFENDYVLEVISNSVRYETWQAHLRAGWVVFMGGRSITVFPPSAPLPNSADSRSRMVRLKEMHRTEVPGTGSFGEG
jgi:hypothetical protein